MSDFTINYNKKGLLYSCRLIKHFGWLEKYLISMQLSVIIPHYHYNIIQHWSYLHEGFCKSYKSLILPDELSCFLMNTLRIKSVLIVNEPNFVNFDKKEKKCTKILMSFPLISCIFYTKSDISILNWKSRYYRCEIKLNFNIKFS